MFQRSVVTAHEEQCHVVYCSPYLQKYNVHITNLVVVPVFAFEYITGEYRTIQALFPALCYGRMIFQKKKTESAK
jgi:hypothetical protein